MLAVLFRRVLPLLVLGSLALSSCVVHERRAPPRGRHHRGYYGRPGPPPGPRF